jgi:hypothetical protein
MRRLITKAERMAARYVPPESTKIAHPDGEAIGVVYSYDKERNGRMFYTAVAYRGTAAHADWHYSYNKPEQRAAKIAEFFDGLSKSAEWRKERKAQRTNPGAELAKASSDGIVRLSTAATAVYVRQALKAAFPRTQFSVTSSVYSMGSSISVRWTDGPTASQVNPILKAFEGAGFDGMTDSNPRPSSPACLETRWGRGKSWASRTMTSDPSNTSSWFIRLRAASASRRPGQFLFPCASRRSQRPRHRAAIPLPL